MLRKAIVLTCRSLLSIFLALIAGAFVLWIALEVLERLICANAVAADARAVWFGYGVAAVAMVSAAYGVDRWLSRWIGAASKRWSGLLAATLLLLALVLTGIVNFAVSVTCLLAPPP